MARGKKCENPRNKVIGVPVTTAEYDAFMARAGREVMRMGEYARHVLAEHLTPPPERRPGEQA